MIQEGHVQHVPLKDASTRQDSSNNLQSSNNNIARSPQKQRSVEDLFVGNQPAKPSLKEILTSLTNLALVEEPLSTGVSGKSPAFASPAVPKPKPLASRANSLNNFAYSLPSRSHDELTSAPAGDDGAGAGGDANKASSLPRRPPPTRGMSLGSTHSLNTSSASKHTKFAAGTASTGPTIEIPKAASEGEVLSSPSTTTSPSLLSPVASSPTKPGSMRLNSTGGSTGNILPALLVKKSVDMLNVALSYDAGKHQLSNPKELISVICNKNAAQLKQISDAFARRSDVSLKKAVSEWSGGEKTQLGRLLEDLLLLGPKETECKLVNRCLVKKLRGRRKGLQREKL
jgi:hypothetical protein